MDEPVGLATPPIAAAAAVPRYFWCRTSTRFVLFFLHIALLFAVISIAPPRYGFDLGRNIGLILVFGCLFSWAVLYHAESRTLIGIFAGVTVAQLAFIALVGMAFRSDNKALEAVMADAVKLRKQDAAAMAPFAMDPLFEMCSGTRPVNVQELAALRLRAQQGRAKLQELESTNQQWLEQTDARLKKVGRAVARQFHEGVDSTQSDSDEIMKVTENYYSAAEQLAAFLIDHPHRYHTTPKGLVFDRSEDEQAFHRQMDSIAQLQDQYQALVQKVEERFKRAQ